KPRLLDALDVLITEDIEHAVRGAGGLQRDGFHFTACDVAGDQDGVGEIGYRDIGRVASLAGHLRPAVDAGVRLSLVLVRLRRGRIHVWLSLMAAAPCSIAATMLG